MFWFLMDKKNSYFFKFFNADLLIYSWSFIKSQKVFSVSSYSPLLPISYKWFYNTAYLIRNGSFKYSTYDFLRDFRNIDRSNYMKVLKYRVIEISFVFLLMPFFLSLFFKEFTYDCELKSLSIVSSI